MFYILAFLSFAAAVAVAFQETVPIIAVLLFIILDIGFFLISFIFWSLVSMALGKNGKTYLLKTTVYDAYFDSPTTLRFKDSDALIDISAFTETRPCRNLTTPQIAIRRYGFGPWRRFFLFDFYEDRYEYILYKNET